MRDILPGWLWRTEKKTETREAGEQPGPAAELPRNHLLRAHRTLISLIEDENIPDPVRRELSEEFRQIEALKDKLRRQEIHIAAFGRVSVGKSSLLNALLNQTVFSTSPLHGETRTAQREAWQEHRINAVFLIDTPGIDELNGDQREALAHEIAQQSDLILFVCDADLTRIERDALQRLNRRQRPLIMVLNKADRYSPEEREQLLSRLHQRCAGLQSVKDIVAVSAAPRPQRVIEIAADGSERHVEREAVADIGALRRRLWDILQREGKTLAALNAALFASELDQTVAEKIVTIKRELAERVVRSYSLGKGVLVAVNPVPVADLLAAAGSDVAMVIHLSQLYGIPMSHKEAGRLLWTIAGQLAALMGAYWGVNLLSSAMKTVSAGLSTVLTAGSQGALAYYATYLVGRAAEAYLVAGKSWGEAGAKQTVQSIVDSLDRESILTGARQEILERLRPKNTETP